MMAFELYFWKKIDTDEITINAESETLSVTKISTKTTSDHTRTIINFYKAIVYSSLDDLDIDISLKNKAGEAYEYDTQIFAVVYGVSGLQNNVDSIIWDRFYYIKNQKVHFEVPIDMNENDITNVNNLQLTNTLNMNNRQIKYLQDGNENNNAVNIKQLNEVENNLQNF